MKKSTEKRRISETLQGQILFSDSAYHDDNANHDNFANHDDFANYDDLGQSSDKQKY